MEPDALTFMDSNAQYFCSWTHETNIFFLKSRSCSLDSRGKHHLDLMYLLALLIPERSNVPLDQCMSVHFFCLIFCFRFPHLILSTPFASNFAYSFCLILPIFV